MSPSEYRRTAITISPILISLFVIYFLLLSDDPGVANMNGTAKPAQGHKYRFETLTGFFAQDEEGTREDYAYDEHNFGLLDRKYDSDSTQTGDWTRWQRFERYVQNLVLSSDEATSYKVIYQGRHGEGYHNVAEAKYGTPAWNAHWAALEGDGELFWLDAHLTSKGHEQAHHNHEFLDKQLTDAGMPAPQSYYSSPLYRCLQTANATWSGLPVPDDRPFRPIVKEGLREVMGVHTCDKRSLRSVIANAVPSWGIEEGFTEEDELWQPNHRETWAEHDARTQAVLEDIFAHDRSTFVSLTSHSGAGASLLRVIGHRQFGLPTGGMMPIFVKATKLS